MNKEQILSHSRSILKAIGSALAGAGVIKESSVEAMVGIAIVIIGTVWSHFNHRKS